MKKSIIYKILFIISIILFVLFIVFIVSDYTKYNSLFNSAPFSAFIIFRMIEFILPCTITLTIALLLKRNDKNENNK